MVKGRFAKVCVGGVQSLVAHPCLVFVGGHNSKHNRQAASSKLTHSGGPSDTSHRGLHKQILILLLLLLLLLIILLLLLIITVDNSGGPFKTSQVLIRTILSSLQHLLYCNMLYYSML